MSAHYLMIMSAHYLVFVLQGLAALLHSGPDQGPFPPAGRAITGRNRANSPVNGPTTALGIAQRTQSDSLMRTASGFGTRLGLPGFSRVALQEADENIED